MSEFNKQDFKVEPCIKGECYEWLLHKHYAHRIPPISYAFRLIKDGIMVGCCTFGVPMSPGLKKCCGEEWESRFFELNRLCVNEGLPRNTLSYFVSQCLKMLPKPMVVVSYADVGQNHHGYIYQATNWIYTGLSAPFQDPMVKGMEHLHHTSIIDLVGRSDRNGSFSHKKALEEKFGKENVYTLERPRKHRYFKFLGNKRERERERAALIYPIEPYPKGDNVRYDASYEPNVQLTLF